MLKERIIEAIEATGFDEFKEIEVGDIIFSKDVFDSCKANVCGNYGKNHSCPPLSGSMEENQQRFLNYKNAIVLGKIAFLGEYYELMSQSITDVLALLNTLREKLKDAPVLIAGPGGCDRCSPCAATTKEPCRFPDEKRYSMEGSGMDIVSMSRKLGMTYNAGDKKVGYFMIVCY